MLLPRGGATCSMHTAPRRISRRTLHNLRLNKLLSRICDCIPVQICFDLQLSFLGWLNNAALGDA